MSLSATLFGTDSAIYKVTNVLGLGVPGLLNKWFGAKDPKNQIQRIGEMASQTAKEGGVRPFIFGRVRPIMGNLIHASSPRIVQVEVEGDSGGGGKGGGKKKAAKQYQERVYRSYAIRICEGPITAIVRVWRNNKLVFDGRGNTWGETNNGVFLRTFRFHLGGWDQMPDPTLEAIWGAGNVPGYRGTCYMVAVEEDLTDMGGSIPQFIFEVERAEGTYLTSKVYPAEVFDAAQGGIGLQSLRDPVVKTDADEQLDGGAALLSLVFRNNLIEYPVTEEIDGAVALQGLKVAKALVQYTEPSEELDGALGLQNMVFRIGLLTYQDPAGFEGIDGEIALQGLSHASV
jgi:hypothetical protein